MSAAKKSVAKKSTAKRAVVKKTAVSKSSKKSAGTKLPFAPGIPVRPFVDPDAVAEPTTSTTAPTLADVQKAYAAPKKQSQSNVLGDPTQNLQTFTLNDLALFTKEQAYSTNASKDVHLFYVGRDDVHDILKYVLSRVTVSLYMNMFGFDDDELNNILMQKALNPSVTMLITLDKSQAGGVHEKALIEADQKYNLAAFNTHFAIGESATHQISHTKGFVADGRVAAEGSTNWSTSGEGTFVVQGLAGGPGLQGAEQHTICHYRPGHHRSLPDGTDRGAHDHRLRSQGWWPRHHIVAAGRDHDARYRGHPQQAGESHNTGQRQESYEECSSKEDHQIENRLS
jgi:hypothetical protein